MCLYACRNSPPKGSLFWNYRAATLLSQPPYPYPITIHIFSTKVWLESMVSKEILILLVFSDIPFPSFPFHSFTLHPVFLRFLWICTEVAVTQTLAVRAHPLPSCRSHRYISHNIQTAPVAEFVWCALGEGKGRRGTWRGRMLFCAGHICNTGTRPAQPGTASFTHPS